MSGRLCRVAGRDAGESQIEREEFGGVDAGRCEGDGVGEAQARVFGAEGRCSARELAVDRDDGGVDRVEELVDGGLAATLERADHDLGVDAGAQEDPVARGESRPEELDGRHVLCVGGIEEGDQDVGVEGYPGHSPRSSSR